MPTRRHPHGGSSQQSGSQDNHACGCQAVCLQLPQCLLTGSTYTVVMTSGGSSARASQPSSPRWGCVDTPGSLCHVKSPVFLEIHKNCSPGWCGPADRAPACEPKDFWFDSQSGHMPALWARTQLGASERHPTGESPAHWCFLPSLSPFLSLSLKVNK